MVARPKKRVKKAVKKETTPQRRGAETSFFYDRDMSMLQFNHRVLQQAQDPDTPILERVRFLSIFHSNLDEFFMKRIGVPRNTDLFSTKLHRQDRMTMIRSKVQDLVEQAAKCFLNDVKPELDHEGIFLLPWEKLSPQEKLATQNIFEKKIFSVLTPLAVDPAHPFPHISNLSTSLAVSIRAPGSKERSFARVKIPKIFPAWFCLNPEDETQGNDLRFVSSHDIIQNDLHTLFPSMAIVSTLIFRITRNIELEYEEERTYDDFVEMVEQELKQRRFGEVVKLEHNPAADGWLLDYLKSELELEETLIFEMPALIDFSSLNGIASLNIPELKFPHWNPAVPKALMDESFWYYRAKGLYRSSSVRKLQRQCRIFHPISSHRSTSESD